MGQWTTVEERLLRELSRTCTVVELCDKLGRTKASVTNRLDKLGISAVVVSKSWTVKDVALLRSMIQDFTYADIAKELGRTEASVRGYANRTGMLDTPRKTTQEYVRSQVERVHMLHRRGLSRTRIAQLTGMSRTPVKKILTSPST